MQEPRITEDTFVGLAMKYYDNPQCVNVEEFVDDLKRFMYLNKLFQRYSEKGILRERLVINHIVVLCNLFGVIAVDFMFFKIDPRYHQLLCTFLIFLNRMPESLPEQDIYVSDIEIQADILNYLEQL